MHLTYLGTNALLIRKAGTTVLVDPHFTRPRIWHLFGKISANPRAVAAGLEQNGVDRLDGVLLTHTHYDHALDAAEVLRQASGVLYGCGSAMNLVNHPGLDKQKITPGRRYQIGALTVVFHSSLHLPFPSLIDWLLPMDGQISRPLETPAWFWHYAVGRVWAIQVDQTLIFGSAGYLPNSYKNLDIETVVLGIGGLDSQPAAYLENFYREAVLNSGAGHVLLSHWDNFFKPAKQVDKPHFLVRRAITRIQAFGKKHGQKVDLLKIQEPLLIKPSGEWKPSHFAAG